jgi:hypothetical protein
MCWPKSWPASFNSPPYSERASLAAHPSPAPVPGHSEQVLATRVSTRGHRSGIRPHRDEVAALVNTEMRLWQRDTEMDRRATAALPSDPWLTPDDDDGGDDNK